MKVNRWFTHQLVSCRSNFKSKSSNLLKRKTFRYSSMSGCNSPVLLKKSLLSRRKGRASGLLLDAESQPQDQTEFVILPTSDSNCSNATHEPLDTNGWSLKLKLKKANSSASSSQPTADLRTDSEKLQDESMLSQSRIPEDDDAAVSFVKEIRTSSRQLPCQKTTNHKDKVHSLDLDLHLDSPIVIENGERQFSDNDNMDCTEQENNDDRMCNKDFTQLFPEESFEKNQNSDSLHLKDDVIDLSNYNSESDDDLVIVASNDDVPSNIGRRALRRIVRCIVFHFLEESDAKDMSTQYVLGRLHRLYHCDFNDRISEIELSIRNALRSQLAQPRQSYHEVRPGVRIGDIDTLSMDNWLNDIIINRYMSMLVSDGKTGFAALSSFWFEEMLKGKEPVLPKDWKTMSKILAPVCINSHWSLLAYIPSRNLVEMYSSLPITEHEETCARTLLNFTTQKFEDPHRKKWLHQIQNLPCQENEHDCGVYVCMFARCIVCGNTFSIAPEQVTEFRYWLKREILDGRLLNAGQEANQ